jgi:hydroxyacyl-ACP dehydratase HTD2-like protein with hotdog domain
MKGKQLSYQDIKTGMEIPALVKETYVRQSAEWAAASGDYDPMHYDREYAKKRGFPDAVVNGRLLVSFLIQMLTNWMGTGGFLKKIECQLRGANIIDKPITCKGQVTGKSVVNDENQVECDIWVEDQEGKKTVFGKATVILY